MKALAALTREQRLVALPAVGLVLSLLLPWYRESRPDGGVVASAATSAVGAFSWTEAALLVVAAAVLALVWLRAQRRAFHLPGGDGWAVTIAGGWALVLLVWRMFDRPDVAAGSVGVEWGLVVSLIMAGLLLAAGLRLRAAHVAEPPNPVATGEHEVVRRVRPRPVAAMPSRSAARADLGLDDPDATRRLPAEDADAEADRRQRRTDEADQPTRRLPAEDADAEADRRQRRTEEADQPTRRLPADGSDDQATRRLPPEDPDARRRLPPDIPPPPTSPPPPPRAR